MPETVTFDQDEGFILVESTGVVSYEELQDSLQQILDIKLNHGLSKVLIDTLKQKNAPSLDQIMDFSEDLPSDMCFAILVDDLSRETKASEIKQKFIESVGGTVGKTVHTFVDKKHAVNWLIQMDI